MHPMGPPQVPQDPHVSPEPPHIGFPCPVPSHLPYRSPTGPIRTPWTLLNPYTLYKTSTHPMGPLSSLQDPHVSPRTPTCPLSPP